MGWSAKFHIDDNHLLVSARVTRWNMLIHRQINVVIWRVMLELIPCE